MAMTAKISKRINLGTAQHIRPVVLGGMVRESRGASPRGPLFQSASVHPSAQATSLKANPLITAIQADVAEMEAYKAALQREEIGLQRPQGSNVRGVDFITARRNARGLMEVIVTDVKMSTTGQFPSPQKTLPEAWRMEVLAAVAPRRLHLGNPSLEQEIREAAREGRIRLRQLHVNYSPSPNGQGRITGF